MLAVHCLGRIHFHAADRIVHLALGGLWGHLWAGCRRLHPAFGVDQEIAGHDNALAGLETSSDSDTIAETPRGFDGARLKVPIASIDVHRLVQAGIDHGVHRDADRGRRRNPELNLREHIRPQRIIPIVDLQPDFQGPRRRVE